MEPLEAAHAVSDGSKEFQLPKNITVSPSNDKAIKFSSPATSNSNIVSSASLITASTSQTESPAAQVSEDNAGSDLLSPSESNLQMRRRHWEIVLAEPSPPICALPRRARRILAIDNSREQNSQMLGDTAAIEEIGLDITLSKSIFPTNAMRRKPDSVSALQRSCTKRPAPYSCGSSLLETMTSTGVPQSRRLLLPSTELSTSVSGKAVGQRDKEGLPVTAMERKPKRFQCQYCGSTFAQRGDMTRHIRVKELGERNFKCEICSKAFGRRSILNKHLDRVHGFKGPREESRTPHRSADAAHALMRLSHK